MGNDATSNCIGLSSTGMGGSGGSMGEDTSIFVFVFAISFP